MISKNNGNSVAPKSTGSLISVNKLIYTSQDIRFKEIVKPGSLTNKNNGNSVAAKLSSSLISRNNGNSFDAKSTGFWIRKNNGNVVAAKSSFSLISKNNGSSVAAKSHPLLISKNNGNSVAAKSSHSLISNNIGNSDAAKSSSSLISKINCNSVVAKSTGSLIRKNNGNSVAAKSSGSLINKNNGNSFASKSPNYLINKNNGNSVAAKSLSFLISKNNGNSVAAKSPGSLIGKNNGDFVAAKSPGSLICKNNGISVAAKSPGSLISKNNGNSDTAKSPGSLIRKNSGNSVASKSPGSLICEINDISVDAKPGTEKITPFLVYSISVHNRFDFLKDYDTNIKIDEVVKCTDVPVKDLKKRDSKTKDVKRCSRLRNKCRNAEVMVERNPAEINDGDEHDGNEKMSKSKESNEEGSEKECFENAPTFEKDNLTFKRKPKMEITWIDRNVTNYARNRFSVLQALSEKEIEAIVNAENQSDSFKVRKKCKRCNSRRFCHLNIMNCTAMNRICFSCNKPNHFPQSRNCLKTRKEKFASKPKAEFECSNQKRKPDFSKSDFKLGPDLLKLIESRIKLIEMYDVQQLHISETDLIPSPLRLRGGGSGDSNKIPAFKSSFPVVDAVADIFRSLQEDWGYFSRHPVCSHSAKKDTGFPCFFVLFKKFIKSNLQTKTNKDDNAAD